MFSEILINQTQENTLCSPVASMSTTKKNASCSPVALGSKKKLSNVLHVRIWNQDSLDLRVLADALGVPIATVLRQAVHYGLPTLKQSLRISAEATAVPMPATPSVSPAPAASLMPSAPCPVIVAGEDPDLNLR